jgi:hypothetical protein
VTLIEESGRRHVIFDDMVSLTEGESINVPRRFRRSVIGA